MERCLQEIAAIEAELLAGNPDVAGLLLGLADWHVELGILHEEQQRQPGSDRAGNAKGSAES
jgi:hypothetical protein